MAMHSNFIKLLKIVSNILLFTANSIKTEEFEADECDVENCQKCSAPTICEKCRFFYKTNDTETECNLDFVKVGLIVAILLVIILVIIFLIMQLNKSEDDKKKSISNLSLIFRA